MLTCLKGMMLRKEHRVTTAHLGSVYPFVAQGGLGGQGTMIGFDQTGGAFCYDPWVQYGKSITNPNGILFGAVGKAKSSLVKTIIYRGSVFGRKAVVIDPKSEYTPLARAMGCEPIALRPGGNVRLNPLSRRADRASQLALLEKVCAASLQRDLTPTEHMICSKTLDALNTEAELHEIAGARPADVEPTLPRVVDKLLELNHDVAAELRTTPEQLLEDSKDLAYALARLCTGDLAGMFDGPTSEGLDLDGAIVVFDLHYVQDSAAISIIMMCVMSWLRSTIQAENANLDPSEQHKRHIIVDEAWRVLGNVACAEWLRDFVKHSRSYGVAVLCVMHRISDLSAGGDAGSRLARLAEGLLSDAETKIIYGQDKTELPLAQKMLGLTDTELELLPTLKRGIGLWLVGDRSFLVRHVLSPTEWDLVNTDARMIVDDVDLHLDIDLEDPHYEGAA